MSSSSYVTYPGCECPYCTQKRAREAMHEARTLLDESKPYRTNSAGLMTEIIDNNDKKSKNNKKCFIQKSLELQQWILDPDSRPYTRNDNTALIARSASTENKNTKFTVAKQLDLQRLILDS
jgi:hypothetical protein